VDFIAKIAASKMGQIKQEIINLRERLSTCKDAKSQEQLRKTIREKETYYYILSDRIKQRGRF